MTIEGDRMKATLEFDLPDEREEYQDVLNAAKNATIVFDFNEIMVKLYNKGAEYFGLECADYDLADLAVTDLTEWICKMWFETRDE